MMSAMKYPLLAQQPGLLYQLHVVWSRPPSWFAYGCGCKTGLGSSPERPSDACYARSQCVINLNCCGRVLRTPATQ